MSKTIQIRDVSDDVYAAMSVRAAEAGISVPELLRRDANRLASRPSVNEWLERLGRRTSDITARKSWQPWTRSGDLGRMLVVDAGCLFEALVGTPVVDQLVNGIPPGRRRPCRTACGGRSRPSMSSGATTWRAPRRHRGRGRRSKISSCGPESDSPTRASSPRAGTCVNNVRGWDARGARRGSRRHLLSSMAVVRASGAAMSYRGAPAADRVGRLHERRAFLAGGRGPPAVGSTLDLPR